MISDNVIFQLLLTLMAALIFSVVLQILFSLVVDTSITAAIRGK